jgi:type III secretion protein U
VSDKTEEPTPKRLRKAREQGDSGTSSYASQAVAFFVVLALVPGAVRALVENSTEQIKAAIAHAGDVQPVAALDAATLASTVLKLALPLIAAAAVVGAVATVVQTGGFVATKRLALQFNRLNVFSGFGQLFSGVRLFSVARALAAAAIIAWLTERALRTHLLDLARTSGRMAYVGLVAGTIAKSVARDAALVGLGIAVIDLLVVRSAWLRRLRMSKDEVKREHKESEGDPQIKAARERAHREMLAAATVAKVKEATVVIVNPTHVAVALRYREGEDRAPLVLATGEDDLAARIARAAREYGIPVMQDVPLARALVELPAGEEIPEELYAAVAEILRELWTAQEKTTAGEERSGNT